MPKMNDAELKQMRIAVFKLQQSMAEASEAFQDAAEEAQEAMQEFRQALKEAGDE